MFTKIVKDTRLDNALSRLFLDLKEDSTKNNAYNIIYTVKLKEVQFNMNEPRYFEFYFNIEPINIIE